jgi:hypothetical protein
VSRGAGNDGFRRFRVVSRVATRAGAGLKLAFIRQFSVAFDASLEPGGVCGWQSAAPRRASCRQQRDGRRPQIRVGPLGNRGAVRGGRRAARRAGCRRSPRPRWSRRAGSPSGSRPRRLFVALHSDLEAAQRVVLGPYPLPFRRVETEERRGFPGGQDLVCDRIQSCSPIVLN